MSVPESRRTENKLEIFMKAKDLAIYTTQICTNPKTFNQQYYATTNNIISIAQSIYVDSWAANNIKVVDSDTFHQRYNLQIKAHRNCNTLLAMIELAHGLYHLHSRRVKYWSKKTIEVRNMISKWKETDSKRYRRFK